MAETAIHIQQSKQLMDTASRQMKEYESMISFHTEVERLHDCEDAYVPWAMRTARSAAAAAGADPVVAFHPPEINKTIKKLNKVSLCFV